MSSSTNQFFLCSQLCASPPQSSQENPNGTPLFMYDIGKRNPSSFQNTRSLAALNGKTCRMLCVSVIQDSNTKASKTAICNPAATGVQCCYNAPGAKEPGGNYRKCTPGPLAALRIAIQAATEGLTDNFWFYPDGTISYMDKNTKITIPTVLPKGSTPLHPQDAADAADWGQLQQINTMGKSTSLSQSTGSFIIPNYTMGYLLFDEGRATNKEGKEGDRILILYNPVHRTEMIEYLDTLKKNGNNGLNLCGLTLSSYAAAVVTKASNNTINGTPEIFGDPMGNMLWLINDSGKVEMRTNNLYIVGNAVTGQNSALWTKLDLNKEMSAIKDDGSAYCAAMCIRWINPSGGNTISSNYFWLPGTDVPMIKSGTAIGAPEDTNNSGQVSPVAIFWWLFTNLNQTKNTMCKTEDINRICTTISNNAGTIPVSPFCAGRPAPNDPHTVTLVIIGIVLGVLVLVGLGVGGWYLYKKKHQR